MYCNYYTTTAEIKTEFNRFSLGLEALSIPLFLIKNDCKSNYEENPLVLYSLHTW